MTRLKPSLIALALAAFGAGALAQDLTSGEVRRVDSAARKITIKHGAIKSMDMPPMTMVYRVRDAAVLSGMKEGDRIMFAAEKLEGQYTVTRLQKAP